MNAIDDYEKGFNQCSTLVLCLEKKKKNSGKETLIQFI